MPNRIIKESICSSDSIDKLSWFEEVFFYRLIVNVDDYGRFDARPAILKARLFPLKNSITEKQIDQTLNRLVTVGMVSTYTVEDKPFLQLLSWAKHQTIRNIKSKYPGPDEADCVQDKSVCKQLKSIESKCSRNPIQSESNPNTNPIQDIVADKPPRQNKTFKPPDVSEVRAYCQERNNNVDAERFVDYYTANGWKVGRNSMKDWKAAVRTWEKNDGQYGNKHGGAGQDGQSASKFAHLGNPI